MSKLKSLSVCDCPELTELTELKVDSLIELKCSNTSIKKLSFKFCPNIMKLDCLIRRRSYIYRVIMWRFDCIHAFG
ncbi:hypothetical protein GLOIN_2v1592996, partial [Rhizophagus irregularis DAOM 181602=DAOM 197198]